MLLLAKWQHRVRYCCFATMLREIVQFATASFIVVDASVAANIAQISTTLPIVSSAGRVVSYFIATLWHYNRYQLEKSLVYDALAFLQIHQVQRRWSETAAAEMSGDSGENTMRRWSMPWDCRHVCEWPRQETRMRLRVPQQDRSRSTTPDSVWKSNMASQDGLQEAIQLLSCKPGILYRYTVQSIKFAISSLLLIINELLVDFSGIRPSNQLSGYSGQYIPGVTLTTCNYDSSYDTSIWPETRRISSPRCWPQDNSDHSDQSGCYSFSFFIL